MKMYKSSWDPVLTIRKGHRIKIITQRTRELKNDYAKTRSFAMTKFITTHLPVTGCSMITRMRFLGGFDDKKQERKAQE